MAEIGSQGVAGGRRSLRPPDAPLEPQDRRFIHGERGGIYIIDLLKTQALLAQAQEFATGVARRGGMILFVGTKKQARTRSRASPRSAACRTSTTAGSAAC